MLKRACDVRLPVQLGMDELQFIGTQLVDAADAVKAADRWRGGASRASELLTDEQRMAG